MAAQDADRRPRAAAAGGAPSEHPGRCLPTDRCGRVRLHARGQSAHEIGEKIDHIDGVTVEEAEHQIATRIYQNTARIHFNQFAAAQGRFGRRLIYGGHVISLARSLSCNGLANAFHVAAINGGRHVAPLFAGATVFAWSQVLAKAELPGREDVGALRLRTIATRDRPCADYPLKSGDDDDPSVILELDYWVLLPR
jgi:2-methylfumaryl-CoA hydratase